MPQIIVAADRGAAFGDGAVTFRETVNVEDFESQHFATQLVERIGWAVEDADQVERVPDSPRRRAEDRESQPISANGHARDVADGPEADAAEADAEESDTEEAEADHAPESRRDERVIVPSPA